MVVGRLVPDSHEWAEVRDDVQRLLLGRDEGVGGGNATQSLRRSTAKHPILNAAVHDLALSAGQYQEWTDEDTWNALAAVLDAVDSVPAREDLPSLYLYCARILLNRLQPPPADGDVIPGDPEGRTLAMLRQSNSEVSNNASFEKAVNVRKIYVAALLGKKTVGSISMDELPMRTMADAVMAALFAYVGERDPVVIERSEVSPLRAYGSLAQQFAEVFASKLDREAPGYPAHLTPSVLAATMTVTSLRRMEVEVTRRRNQRGLYGDPPTSGGVNALKLLQEERRVVLLGDPGGGKSTLLAAHVIEEVRDRSNPSAVKCRLSDLAVMLGKRREKSMPLGIAAHLKLIIRCAEREADLRLGQGRNELIELLSKSPHAVIALDGLDEVPGHLRGVVSKALAALDKLPGRLLVSSRRLGYQSVPWRTFKEFSVDHLSLRQSRAFLDDWFQGRLDSAAHRGAVGAIKGVHSVSRQVPVLLGIIAMVAGEPGSVPSTASELYDRYLDVFLQRRWDPPECELTADEVEIQKAVARQIAWSMALGGSRDITSSRWADVLSVARLNRAVEHANKPIAASLYATAGLLVAHGSTLYKGAQEVRWLHRTLHEYLVGTYLAELYIDDFDRWKEHFTYILQTRGTWEVAVQFMIASLEPEQQTRVFSHARGLRQVGDPGCVTLTMMAQMARMTPRGSLLRRQTAADLAAEGMWELAGELHRETQRRLYLIALKDPARRVATLLETLGDHLSLDAEIVGELRCAVAEVPSSSVGLIFKIIDTVYWWFPDDGLAMAVEAVLRGLPWGIWVRAVGVRPSDRSVRRALTALADDPQDLINFLAYIGVDLLGYSADFPWISAYKVAREAQPILDEVFEVPEGPWAEMLSPRLPSAIQRQREHSMLTGTYGSYSAFKASQILSANEKRYTNVSVSEWAILGRRIKLLRSRRGFSRDTLEFRITFDEGCLLRIDAHQVHELTQVLDIIAAWILFPNEVPMRTLLRFCLALNDRAASESGAPREALLEMRDLVLGEMRKRPQEAIAALLATDSELWIPIFGGPRGRRHQEGLWNHNSVTEDEIRAAVCWAASGGLDVIPGLRVPERPSEWLKILELNGTKIEDLPPQSRFVVAKWLAFEGTLVEWRDRLIAA